MKERSDDDQRRVTHYVGDDCPGGHRDERFCEDFCQDECFVPGRFSECSLS